MVRWSNHNGNGTLTCTISNCNPSVSCSPLNYSIPLRYIGPVGPIKLNSVAYTGTTSWACGTASVTVSVDPVTNATHYYWDWPSGWTGPGYTTSNSVSVVPGKSSEGQIMVTARRSDVPVHSESRTLNITRPLPTISSISQESMSVCNSSTTVTISASGSGADSFRWQPSASVKINGVNATTTTSSPVLVSTSGEGHVDVFAYSTGCDVASTTSKRLYTRYGPPVITDRLINGIPEHLYVPYYPAEVPNGSRIAIPSTNVSSYSWTLVAGTAPLWPVSGNEHMCDISYIIDYARIEGKATNSCGSSTHLFYLVPPGGSMLVAYPNPATETLTLQLATIPQAINLYTEASTIAVKSINSKAINNLKSSKDGKHEVILNVKDLPRGIYYLHIEQKDKKTERIRVQLI